MSILSRNFTTCYYFWDSSHLERTQSYRYGTCTGDSTSFFFVKLTPNLVQVKCELSLIFIAETIIRRGNNADPMCS